MWTRDESKTGRYQLLRLYRVALTKTKMVVVNIKTIILAVFTVSNCISVLSYFWGKISCISVLSYFWSKILRYHTIFYRDKREP